jgi:hypothetical protein
MVSGIGENGCMVVGASYKLRLAKRMFPPRSGPLALVDAPATPKQPNHKTGNGKHAIIVQKVSQNVVHACLAHEYALAAPNSAISVGELL